MKSTRAALARVWPMAGLRLATPRLVLEPVTDEEIPALVDRVVDGIHDPADMPFGLPWTDAPPAELVVNSVRHWWAVRAESRPENWAIEFAVRHGDRIMGIQEIRGRSFAVTRSVSTGSWLGRAFQGNGFGTEMRSAVVQFAFDHLGAIRATSGAFEDNPSSLAVSRALGYRFDGTDLRQRRPGEAALSQRLLLSPDTFVRPAWQVQVRGLDATRASLGLSTEPGDPRDRAT